jgi:hypothetical protein
MAPSILMGETAEIFGFSFVFRDALSSVYEISMEHTNKPTNKRKNRQNIMWCQK